MRKPEKKDIIATLTEMEVNGFLRLEYQRSALLELLGEIKEKETNLWRAVRIKYKLGEKKGTKIAVEYKTGHVYKRL